MGRLRFYVHAESQTPLYVQQTQFLNAEGLPYQVRTKWEAPYLIVNRGDTDSGQLLTPWSSSQYGVLALTTGTLIEQERPYNLVRELARGTLNRLRNQTALWQLAGLILPDEYLSLHKSAVQWLSKSAVSDDDQAAASRYGQLALELALQGISVLCAAYAKQALQNRQRLTNKPVSLIGTTLSTELCDVPTPEMLLEACNTLAVPFSWKQIGQREGQFRWAETDKLIAWAQTHQQRVCAGPLIDFTKENLPDWLVLWEDDYDNLLHVTTDYIKQVVTRYKGRVQIWNVASKINTTPAIKLTDEQRLRLTAKLIETLRSIDAKTPVVVTLDQPGGEGLWEQGSDITPLQFADALVRADLGLVGVGLEYTIGLTPGLTLPRDPLAFCQQLDMWTLLNVAVLLFLENAPPGPGTPMQQQANWLGDYGPAMLGKQIVQGLIWNQAIDAKPTQESDLGQGLFTHTGQAKPVLKVLKTLKQLYGN
jgi:hypothetical protein